MNCSAGPFEMNKVHTVSDLDECYGSVAQYQVASASERKDPLVDGLKNVAKTSRNYLRRCLDEKMRWCGPVQGYST